LELAEKIKTGSSLLPATQNLSLINEYGGRDMMFGKRDQFSLDDTYLAYDLRESFLQRQSNPLGNQADSTILATDDFETKTCNVCRTNDSTKSPDDLNMNNDINVLTHKQRVSIQIFTRFFRMGKNLKLFFKFGKFLTCLKKFTKSQFSNYSDLSQ
jgi:hypothetical protein